MLGRYVIHEGCKYLLAAIVNPGIADERPFVITNESTTQFPGCDGRLYLEGWALRDNQLTVQDRSRLIGKHYKLVSAIDFVPVDMTPEEESAITPLMLAIHSDLNELKHAVLRMRQV